MRTARNALDVGLTEGMRVAVVDNLSDGIYFVDRRRRILYWNKGAELVSGFSAEEVVGRRCGQTLLNHCDEEGVDVCGKRCPLMATMRDGERREAHVFLRHKDGHRRPVCVRAAALRDDAGKIVGAVETFHDDSAFVDSRRRARTEQTLRSQGEVRFGALVQNSSDAIFILDRDTLVSYASPSVAKVLGHLPHELHGLALLDHVRDADRERARLALQGWGEARSASRSETVELQIRHGEGHFLHAECLVTNLLDDDAVGGVVVNLRDITERKRFEEQLTHQAFHDMLTGLANRALFRDRLEHALARRRGDEGSMVILFVGLDDFKSINDTLGHACGDELLRETAKRLQAGVRAGDTVARLGGDEFAVLLEEIEYEAAVEIVERLLNVVRPPLILDDREVFVQCSIGVTTVDGTGDDDVDILLRDADVAMYAAKRGGGNTYCRFEPEMQAAVADRIELRDELRAAIEHGELTLVYQPIFDFQTGEVEGVEALARWEHLSRGAVPPSAFIPVAEDSGLIVGLGNWVLRTACGAATALQQAAPRARRPSISVNVSAGQLYRPELVEEVRAALAVSGLEPRGLILEITESLLIDDITLAIERLTALRALGVRIALDDFGTGYSSLSYIRRLPIDRLKIDKRFIDTADRDDRDSKLTATIIEMARVLDLDTVAEGIERPQQHQQLKQLGCTYAQGFLLARPMSIDQVQQLINETPAPLKRVA